MSGRAPAQVRAAVRALRPHHWVKNLLLFLPLLMAHQVSQVDRWFVLMAAFGGFSLTASGMYVTNDLLDLDADRRHPTKRRRPFAAGVLSPRVGVGLAATLLVAGFVLGGVAVSGRFAGMLAIYVALAGVYSVHIKRVPVLDILALAGLYTLRVLAGGVASETALSSWLLSFATFFFLSLAMLKRHTELRRHGEETGERGFGRGYVGGDAELLANVGPACGYMSVLVLALYLHGENVTRLYARPELLWLLTPLLLYWITRLWLLAHRGRIHDDPIVFAIRDGPSYLVGALAAGILLVATF